MNDGIQGMLPREQMSEGAKRYWDFYNMRKGAGFYQREFGFYSLDKWRSQEWLAENADLDALFGFDAPGRVDLHGLGWCEAGFLPLFEEKVLEDRGEYELIQDFAGRSVLCFKNRRNGFMPEYVTHPVKDRKTWEEHCLWRMDPLTPERESEITRVLPDAIQQARQGMFVGQSVVGGYMYLRSLIGPEELLYMFYDDPALIHACMRAWLELADSVIARHQQAVSVDELFLAEDICYNHGSLISPDMIREFLFPYYQQLLTNMKRRQLDKARAVHFQLDTDGFSDAVLGLYRTLNLNHLSPFEVASGCDVIRTGSQYPDLRISGGIDKRVLATTPAEIDRMIDRIFPVMQARGGYLPTCDHGVPEEVSFKNYLHFRKRCLEFR
jgi:hypothetical protein